MRSCPPPRRLILALWVALCIGCGAAPLPNAPAPAPTEINEPPVPDWVASPAPFPAPPAAPTPAPAGAAAIPQPPTPTIMPTARVIAQRPDEFLFIPDGLDGRRPATLLVALHGVESDGRAVSAGLLPEAQRNGWLVLAPTIRYQNWHDPASVAREDAAILPRLKATIDGLPERTGLRLRKRILLYGFSRGGQVAHRFALAYPGRVLGVATLSAGTYTLPQSEIVVGDARRPLPLPYGTADLPQRLDAPFDAAAVRQVAFWIAVGANDNRDVDVPAAWTPYIGPNRLARARAFKAALDRLGAPASLAIFPGVDHREAPEMRTTACAFLRGLPAEGKDAAN